MTGSETEEVNRAEVLAAANAVRPKFSGPGARDCTRVPRFTS